MEADSAYAPAHEGRGVSASGPERAGSAGRGEAGEQWSLRRAGSFVFAALVLATVGGLFLAQRIKHTPTSVQGFELHPVSFSPAARGRLASEQVSFRIARNDRVTVAIVDASGDTVATLVRNLPWQRYLRLCLSWNGRRGVGAVASAEPARRAAGICPAEPAFVLPAGRLAPPGDYRARVSLQHQGRPVLSPSSFALLARATGSS
jgi:hypothetical protein